jgi:ParB family transcriptional regulator, chromosome partitioning protein
MKPKQAKGLGMGLGALLGADLPTTLDSLASPPSSAAVPAHLSLARMQAGRYQPRTRMDEAALQELAQSILTHGLMQPIVVRPLEGGEVTAPSTRFEIIAGERRFRAAKLAGLSEVPVVVREVPDEQALALALIENIQRENLNPLEEAQAVQRLIQEFSYSHEQAAQAIGRSRPATSNLLRLLQLAESVQTMLLAGDLDMGHARALLPLDPAQQTMLAMRVVEKGLTVRDTEAQVAGLLQSFSSAKPPASAAPNTPPAALAAPSNQDRDLLNLQEHLAQALGTDVSLKPNRKGGGQITIHFSSHEQFEGLLERLQVSLPQA